MDLKDRFDVLERVSGERSDLRNRCAGESQAVQGEHASGVGTRLALWAEAARIGGLSAVHPSHLV